MGRESQATTETALMRRIAERFAGASGAENGLAGVVPLLSRHLKADLGVFLVRQNEEWVMAGHGAYEEFRRTLPRTPRLASRAENISLADLACRNAPGREFAPASIPDSVLVPVRAGRRSIGYGVFRTGAAHLPSPGMLRLLDAIGAQVAAFCECVSRGDRAKSGSAHMDRLVRANRDLGWLLRFGETLHAHADPDSMFKWLGRELGLLSPIHGVELVSLPGGPVVRIATDLATKVSARRDGAAIAREWSETLSSRYRVPVPEGDFRLKRFACLPVAGSGIPSAGAPDVKKAEAPMYHAGQVLGVLAVYHTAGSPDDRRIDGLIESVAGQIGLFLHKHADREKIRFLANHDALTGLFNQLSFQNIFEREFERHRRHDRNLSLLFVDIDHFKRINDDYGHQVGDRVLREVARIQTANLRKIDYVFRYGGDEFVVLMTETDSQRATMLAHRIRAAVKREIGGMITGSRLRVSISIGIADCNALSQVEREELLFRADGALYQAKNGGRDQVRVAELPVDIASGVN
jgi:diguanylate cyclase (GGDEF)-like protein